MDKLQFLVLISIRCIKKPTSNKTDVVCSIFIALFAAKVKLYSDTSHRNKLLVIYAQWCQCNIPLFVYVTYTEWQWRNFVPAGFRRHFVGKTLLNLNFIKRHLSTEFYLLSVIDSYVCLANDFFSVFLCV